mmetsp:Transcript_44404/g.71389  ORF Transcript_44404/g.71389 Transcript_44404/m.71389 type:complete len:83 (+) Transcript_44404:94-342(+)
MRQYLVKSLHVGTSNGGGKGMHATSRRSNYTWSRASIPAYFIFSASFPDAIGHQGSAQLRMCVNRRELPRSRHSSAAGFPPM